MVSVAVSLAPLLWMLSAWVHHGSPFASFGEALPDADPVGAAEAVSLTVKELSNAVGYFIVVASLLGGALGLVSLRSGPTFAGKAIYLSVAVLQLAFLAWYVSRRGSTLWDRYVLISAVIIIPLAAYTLSTNRALVSRYLVGIALVGSMLFAVVHIDRGTLYIRAGVPDAVSEAAAWLDGQLEPGQTFISTRLKGDAPTIDLLTESAPYNVAYSHNSAEELQGVWNAVQPSYVVVLAGEDPGDRLLRQFKDQIDFSAPPKEFDKISIYRLKRAGAGDAPAQREIH
jgi:hypothetical protein